MSNRAVHPSQWEVCAVEGHLPLHLPGSEVTFVPLTHTKSGVQFARMKLCTRCGGVYWEPEET